MIICVVACRTRLAVTPGRDIERFVQSFVATLLCKPRSQGRPGALRLLAIATTGHAGR
jgi:hypothetical protein